VPLLAAVTLAVSAALGAAPASAAEPQVVATGLDNPRQLALAPDGSLYIAQAGRGGRECSEEAGCVGLTSSIGRVANPRTATNVAATRVVGGLISASGPNGEFAVGADGVSTRGPGETYVAMVWAPPDLLDEAPGSPQAGKLLRITADGRIRFVADIAEIELRDNPDRADVYSNPYAVLALRDRQIVVDAGGNTLIEVRNGQARVLTIFPRHDGRQSVPTSIALGPDGNYYVGELNGEGEGTARVWKVAPSGKILGWTGGFDAITGVAVDRRGVLYVSQLFSDNGQSAPPGKLTRVTPYGSRQSVPVPLPAGVAVDGYGTVYVSAWSVSDRNGAELFPGFVAPPGQVWRIRF